jgi:hypothetical protein
VVQWKTKPISATGRTVSKIKVKVLGLINTALEVWKQACISESRLPFRMHRESASELNSGMP